MIAVDINKLKRRMNTAEKIIFVADNNQNDRDLLIKALEETHVPFRIEFSGNGRELLKNLEIFYAQNQSFPKMILLDFNLDKDGNGLEILKTIKAHFLYKTIPVLILSSKKTDEYVVQAYNLGANSFIVKPGTLKEFQDFVQTLNKYWFELAALPMTFHSM
jgi:CheY-like chemotaxis protein